MNKIETLQNELEIELEQMITALREYGDHPYYNGENLQHIYDAKEHLQNAMNHLESIDHPFTWDD